MVHHLVVERLEGLYEPVFIHDSYANRTGKGSHAAVARLQMFMLARRQMAPAGGGWYLQLGIHNYFNSIHRPTLYAMLCTRLALAERCHRLAPGHALALRSLCHKLLAAHAPEHVRDPAAAARLPAHRRLCNAARGCGLPVGNLTSQFFANVYLNGLDQFVKHTLKLRHYLRYVDDFVLLANMQEQLQQWRAQIETFLHDALRLAVKQCSRLQPCSQGVDFLGYRVFADRRQVRPRLVRHCRTRLECWCQQHGRALRADRLQAAEFAKLHAMPGSCWGHFAHADSVRLRRQLLAQRPWLGELFAVTAAGRLDPQVPARWQVRRHRAVRELLKPKGESP